MPSEEIRKVLSRVGRKVHFRYPGREGEKKGILKDRSVTQGGKVGSVRYWDVIDLIEFEGESQRMIRIGYYRKPKDRMNWASQTTITEPLLIWKKMLVKAARDKSWFRKLLNDVMNELENPATG